MKIVKLIQKKLVTIIVPVIIANSLLVSSAHAVNPDPQFALSGIWTQTKLLLEYFDWRSGLGWGTIGSSNVLVSKITGASDGAMTKAVYTAICGTTAAGLLAKWTPRAEPGWAYHMKSIVKSGSVVGAASVCGWSSQFAFQQMDQQSARAALTYELSGPNITRRIDNDERAASSEHISLQTLTRTLSRAEGEAISLRRESRRLNCGANPPTQQCNSIRARLLVAVINYDNALAGVNNHGRALSADLHQLNIDLSS